MKKEIIQYVKVIVFSLLLFVPIVIFNTGHSESFISNLNKSFALIGFILIGMSFALSGICYFWNILDSDIQYRKYLGIVGFAYIVTHVFFTLVLLNSIFPIPDYYLKNIVSFVSAFIALIVFTLMASISNRYSIQKIGALRWKRLLFLGYPAYVLSLLHFGLKQISIWEDWLINFLVRFHFPPITLVVFLFGISVILLRIALQIHKNLHFKRSNV